MGRNNMNSRRLILFIFAVLFMGVLGFFKHENKYDLDFRKIKLIKGQTLEYSADLAKLGKLKYILEPNIFSVSLRIIPDKEDVRLSVRHEGMEMFLSKASKKSNWIALREKEILTNRKSGLQLQCEFYVPKEDVKKYQVAKGKIEFVEEGSVYATLNVNVINSNYK